MSISFTVDTEERFVAVPAAALSRGDARIVWPAGSLPAALDPAAAAILGCFDAPLRPVDLAEDLVDALEMAPTEAAALSARMIATFLGSGHLVSEHRGTPSLFGYPPRPST